MKNIIEKLKILTGRKLSEKDMKSIVIQHEPYQDCIYREGDQIVKIKYMAPLVVSDEISHPRIKQKGNYYVGEDTNHYNNKGLLIEKNIIRIEPMGCPCKYEIIVYDKPGQFIGKKEDRYQELMKVVKLEKNDWLIVESKINKYNRMNYRISHISPESRKPIEEIKFKGKNR